MNLNDFVVLPNKPKSVKLNTRFVSINALILVMLTRISEVLCVCLCVCVG